MNRFISSPLRFILASELLVCLAVTGCGGDEASKPPGDPASKAGDPNATSSAPMPNPAASTERLLIGNRAMAFTGRLSDQTPFDSRELDGFVWIGVVLSDKADTPVGQAYLTAIDTAVEDHPWKSVIRKVGFSAPPESNDQKAGSRELTGDWIVIEIDADVLQKWQSQGKSAENAAAGMSLVDGSGRLRGERYSFTEEGTKSLVNGLTVLLGEMVATPPDLLDVGWMAQGQKSQIEAAKTFKVPHDFQFVDRRIESGITYRNKIVDDAGKTYKACHYDHGTGISIADVDLDGLEDIYFVNQVGGSELWRNVGDGKFENITSQAGVALADRIGVAASFADIDNDGDPDLFVTTVRGGNALFENDGAGIFRDISKTSGTDHVGHSSGALFFDYNLDGRLDLFVTNVGQYTSHEQRTVTMEAIRHESNDTYHFYAGYDDAFAGHLKSDRAERSLLYENTGNNVFRDVTEETGLIDENWTGDACPLDVNLDGWPDLYVTNMQGNDEYYENQAGKSFVRKGRDYFPRTPWGSMCSKPFDYDNDGDFDLFITDMHSDMSQPVEPHFEKQKSNMQFPESFLQTNGQSIFGNAFFRNDGGGKYTEFSDPLGVESYWPWGFSVADLNADGFTDIFITASMNLPFRYGINSLLLNDRGERFLEAEFALGVEPRRGGRFAVPWYEIDCNGVDAKHEDCAERTGKHVVWSSLGSRSSAIFDLDQDGDLDIVTNDFNTEPLVLISNLGQRPAGLKFLKIQLEGTKSNRQGLGAVVRVKVGETTWTQVNDGKSGYLSQSAAPLYFGLGAATEIDAVEIRWPSGKEQTVSGPLQINGLLHVTETSE